MTQLSKAAFLTKFNTLFADNTTRDISEADLRTLAEDLKDSVPFNLDTSIAQVVTSKITIPSSEVLTLNATPKTIVSAGGSGTVIEVLSFTLFLDYNSVSYATNTTLTMTINSQGYFNNTSILPAGADVYYQYNSFNGLALAANTPVLLSVATGNPTAGNSPLYVYVTYRVITL